MAICLHIPCCRSAQAGQGFDDLELLTERADENLVANPDFGNGTTGCSQGVSGVTHDGVVLLREGSGTNLPSNAYYLTVRLWNQTASGWAAFDDVSLTSPTKYYYLGGSRVAMRQGETVHYLAGDHLGTTSAVLSAAGSKVAESRHYPYGGVRESSGQMPTDYRFTGQLLDASAGLYHMGARWYDPYINRWVSPDTIIPDPANPQSLNRYSYVLGNPLCVA